MQWSVFFWFFEREKCGTGLNFDLAWCVFWLPILFFLILGSEKQVLYVADDNEIRSLYPGMQNWIYEQAFQGDANVRIDAMDVHIKSKRIFWTNWHTGRISSFEQPSNGPVSPNSNRNRRQTDPRVTDLEVRGASHKQKTTIFYS